MSATPNPHAPAGSLLDEVLATVLAELAGVAATDPAGAGAVAVGRAPAVLDCGGGSGSRAVPLAVRGAMVTVIDSSIDALAILARRAGEAGVSDQVRGVQADVESLAEVAGPATADLVLVHGVLDATREPAAVLAAAIGVVRPGGYLSVVVPNPVATVLARALAGELSTALAELEATDPDPRTARPASGATWLDLQALRSLVESGGLAVTATHGLGAFSASVPGSVLDGRPAARAVLEELDRRGAVRSPYREIAGRLHLLAHRGPVR